MEKDSLTTLLARGLSVEKIAQRFGKHPSTIAYWMAKYGLEAPNREKHDAKGGIAREQLEQFTEAGMTIAEIAAAVDLSKTPCGIGSVDTASRRETKSGRVSPKRRSLRSWRAGQS